MHNSPMISATAEQDVPLAIAPRRTTPTAPAPTVPPAPADTVVISTTGGAVSDVVNLFASFGDTDAAGGYQEIVADADAVAVAERWPLMREWLAAPRDGKIDPERES